MTMAPVKTCLVSVIIKRNSENSRFFIVFNFFFTFRYLVVRLDRDTFQLERNFHVQNVASLKKKTSQNDSLLSY